MINNLLPFVACIITFVISVLLIAAKLTLKNCFASVTERLLVSSGVFVLVVNLTFGLLSQLPLKAPLLLLALPIHYFVLSILFYMVGINGFRVLFTATTSDIRSFFRKLHPFWYLILFAFAVLLLFYAAQGIFTVPGGVDELSYHLPQAVGMVQEGRARAFDVPPSWVFHYPQGASTLWAWTMLFTGGDQLFRLVQFWFGLQLLVSTGLLAWRMGADRISALLVVLAVIAMPIFYVLTTTINADLGYAAAIISFLVFLSPSRVAQSINNSLQDLLAACLFMAQAALIKIPVTAVIYFVFACGAFFWERIGLGNGKPFLGHAAKAPITWIVLLFVGMSFNVYILNWIETGNPMFPLTLRVGGAELFKGTLKPIEDIVMGHSTFGPVSGMNILQRWHAVFCDWFQPLNQDAFGGPGPIFILSTLFMAALGVIDRLRRTNAWTIALCFILVSVFLIPAAYLPRYSLSWLCLLLVAASLAFTKIRRILPSAPFVMVVVLLIGISAQVQEMRNTFTWVNKMSFPEPWYINRGRSTLEKLDVDRSLAPTGAMLKVMRDNIKKNDSLVYSVNVYAALMWNREYSNHIRFIPINNDLQNQSAVPSVQDQSRWVSRINDYDPDWILVYSASGLLRALADQHTDRGYALVFSDADTGHEDKDRWNMALLHRVR